jgi:dTDP-3-amino-2,3,6-trideoxy-4-keto-D-glucose/dTDP-3-amino-3,4,6-trideoxy-alpha-D-glucose/dTDP-2,6-dideoxy-D-kanosamine transaminase
VKLGSINELGRVATPYRDEVEAAIRRVLDRGWYVLGPEVEAFERELSEYLQTSHVVGVASGTDALILALRVAGAEGRMVVLAANAGMYATLAVLQVGGEPVFVDVDPQLALMDLDAARRLIEGGDLAAVVVTHLYGRMHALEGLVACARRHGVVVIEDCAQAHGARRNGALAGTVGDLGCFSFYPTKNLGALGDAGAVATRDAAMAATLRQLRQYGWTEKYRVGRPGGMNSRLDELQAAVLRTRLPHLDSWNRMRRDVATWYRHAIRHGDVFVPPFDDSYVAHLMVVRVRDRPRFTAHLRAAGVPFEIHYPLPDHRQPVVADRFVGVDLPHTVDWAREVVTLPCFPGMTREEVEFVAGAVNAW